MRWLVIPVVIGGVLAAPITHHAASAPAPETVRFAVIGDGGTGLRPQYEIGERMAAVRASFPFDLVLMLGDNFYGRQGPDDLRQKFDRPYAALLAAGVIFRAALGNHDDPQTRFYPPLNIHGARYYTFAHGMVRFVVLDTNAMDDAQLAWLDRTLAAATEPWKIGYFHHPLYSSAGRHGSSIDLRVVIEPLLVRHGVQAVWSGHDHAYERLRPQKGIQYFVAGSAGQLRRDDIRPSALTAASFDQDQSFMLVEVTPGELRFRAISRTGATVDAGTIPRRPNAEPSAADGPAGRAPHAAVASR